MCGNLLTWPCIAVRRHLRNHLMREVCISPEGATRITDDENHSGALKCTLIDNNAAALKLDIVRIPYNLIQDKGAPTTRQCKPERETRRPGN